MGIFRFGLGMLALAAMGITGCGKAPDERVSFSRDVMPILQARCLECHGEGGLGAQASGLRLDGYAALMAGTRFGPVVRPGDGLSSTLAMLVEGRADPSLRMPHGDRPPLAEAETRLIRRWIDQGAQND